MKKLIFGLLLLGLTTQIYAQEPEKLPEVVIVHNYKYLNAVNPSEAAVPIEKLQMKVSNFNVKELDIYTDEYDLYDVYFFIPEGKVLASYDKEGNLLRTVERYKDVNLPMPILNSVIRRFPNWTVTKNTYVVNYHDSGKTKKMYKLTLENGKQLIRVKLDDHGVFQ